MAIIKAKPTSPGRRFRVQISSDLHKEDQKKNLLNLKIKFLVEITMEELL